MVPLAGAGCVRRVLHALRLTMPIEDLLGLAIPVTYPLLLVGERLVNNESPFGGASGSKATGFGTVVAP